MKAEALLKEAAAKDGDDPEKPNLVYLLCKKVISDVPDPSSKPIKNLTPFQAALCAGDVGVNEGDFQMCEIFKDHFEKIPHGLEKMQKQFNEIFPEGVDKCVEYQKIQAETFKEDLNALIRTILAADDAQVQTMLDQKHADSPLGEAFVIFRNTVEALYSNKQEKVFNPYYLLNALKIKGFIYEHDSNHGFSNRTALYMNQVIGFIQRGSSACLLQAFAHNLDSIFKGELYKNVGSPASKYLYRSPTLSSYYKSEGVDVLRIDPVSSYSGLGFDYYGGEVCIACCGATFRSRYLAWIDADPLKQVLERKNKRLKILFENNPHPSSLYVSGNSIR